MSPGGNQTRDMFTSHTQFKTYGLNFKVKQDRPGEVRTVFERSMEYRIGTRDLNPGSVTLAMWTLGKLVNLSGPTFPHLKSGGGNRTYIIVL